MRRRTRFSDDPIRVPDHPVRVLGRDQQYDSGERPSESDLVDRVVELGEEEIVEGVLSRVGCSCLSCLGAFAGKELLGAVEESEREIRSIRAELESEREKIRKAAIKSGYTTSDTGFNGWSLNGFSSPLGKN